MNPLQQLKEQLPALTQSEQKAAQFILDQPKTMITISLTDLAKASGASNSAIIRLSQKLGYAGYSEFKFSVRRALLGGDTDTVGLAGEDPFQHIIDTYIRFINQLPACLDRAQLTAIARDLCNAKHLHIWGINRTALLAEQLHLRLSRLGVLSSFTDDAILMGDQCSILGAGDVCVVFTLQGRGTTRYGSMLANLKSGGVTTVLVTMNPNLPYVKTADYPVVLPCISRADAANFYEDQIIGYMFIELLLYELSRL